MQARLVKQQQMLQRRLKLALKIHKINPRTSVDTMTIGDKVVSVLDSISEVSQLAPARSRFLQCLFGAQESKFVCRRCKACFGHAVSEIVAHSEQALQAQALIANTGEDAAARRSSAASKCCPRGRRPSQACRFAASGIAWL